MKATLGVLLALCGTSSCREAPLTQLVVVVATDMEVPAVIDGFAVRVIGSGPQLLEDRTYRIGSAAGQATLPADFGVAPKDGDASVRVTVEVDAQLGETVLFTTRAITGFVEGRVLRLDMFLAGRCVDETCAAEETCRPEGCVPAEIDPGDLPDFREGCDEDGDGFENAECGGEDCDDADPAVNPGASEGGEQSWAIETIVASAEAGRYARIAVDAAGVVHVVHLPRVVSVSRVEHWSRAPEDGPDWTPSVVPGDYDAVPIDLALDPDGEPVVVAADVASRNLFVSHHTPGGWEQANLSVTAGAASVASSPDGATHVAFEEVGSLQYGTDELGGWAVEVLDKEHGAGGRSDLAVSPEGIVHLAYTAAGTLRYRSRTDGAWESMTATLDEPRGGAAEPSIAVLGEEPVVCYEAVPDTVMLLRRTVGVFGDPEILATDANGGEACSVATRSHLSTFLAYRGVPDGNLHWAADYGFGFSFGYVEEEGLTERFVSIAVEQESGVPHVAYRETSGDGTFELRHAVLQAASDGVDRNCNGRDED